MVKKISKQYYLTSQSEHNNIILPNNNGHMTHESLMNPNYHYSRSTQNHHQRISQRGYSTDGEDSRAPSERTMSEYMIANERNGIVTTTPRKHHNSSNGNGSRARSRSQESRGPPRPHSAASHHSVHRPPYDDGISDVYVTTAAYRPPSEISRGSRYSHHSRPASTYSYRSGPPAAPSEISTVKTKTTRRPGVTIETMSAPNPFCPNTKGICCLMLLLNLGLILVTLGFVIVIQFFEPLFVWVLGIVFLIFGFLTLMGSLIYCVYVCRDAKTPKQVAAMQEPYWTHHWQKSFGATPPPGSIMHYKTVKYPPSEHDRYSDGYSDRHKSRY